MRAILMAAGLGSRMRPLTKEIPKPLVEVNNMPLIETIISALESTGVSDIVVVGGYKGYKLLEYIKLKHPNIKYLYNPYYEKCNNISSLYVAREYLDTEVLICEADLYIMQKDIFKHEYNKSGYFSYYRNGKFDDWSFDVDDKNNITKINRVGNNNYMMTGLAYFTKRDAMSLAHNIENAFENLDKKLFWDEVVDMNLLNTPMTIYKIPSDALVELDTVEELNEFVSVICKK